MPSETNVESWYSDENLRDSQLARPPALVRFDKRDQHLAIGTIQAGVYDRDHLGTRPDDRRGMGIL